MAEPKWTPGPLVVEPASFNADTGEPCFYMVRTDVKNGVASSTAYIWLARSDQEAKANAFLYAAAPDLDNACDPVLLDTVARVIDNYFGPSGHAKMLRILASKQRAAKAKARGEVTP